MMADTLGLACPCCWTLLLQRCVSLVQQVIAPSELIENTWRSATAPTR